MNKFFKYLDVKMMKLQIANEQDRKEAQNRERRRQCELERRSRIFNARNRKIGVRTHNHIKGQLTVGAATIF